MSKRTPMWMAGCSVLAVVIVAAWGVGARAAEPAYPESPEGLKKLTQDVLAAMQGGKEDAAKALIKTMVLPDHENWFKKTFGEEKGKPLAEEYAAMSKNFEAEIAKLFAQQVEKKRTEVSAYKVTDANDREATGGQQAALAAMKQKVPLYGVRLVEPGKTSGFHMWSFVYADGGFRLVGKMRGGKAG